MGLFRMCQPNAPPRLWAAVEGAEGRAPGRIGFRGSAARLGPLVDGLRGLVVPHVGISCPRLCPAPSVNYDSCMSNVVVEPRVQRPTIIRQPSSNVQIRLTSWAWSVEQEVGIGTGDEAGWAGRLAVREHADDLRRLADA
jgi:hypothetical protein